MPRRSPIPPGEDPKQHPALSGGHVVIISGEKPIYKQHMKGAQGHAALGSILDRDGFEYEPIHGKYNGEKQPGYIVHARDEGEVEKLKGIAKRMGQEAIVHSHAGKHQYVYTAGDDEGKATPPSSGVNWFGDQEPDDNYTTLYGASGEPIGHFSYNIDFNQPLVPHGKGPMVDVPEAAQMVLKSAVEAYRGILIDLRKREMEKKGAKPAKKYEVEAKRTVTHGPKPVSDDISAQGFITPSQPYNDTVVGGGSLKTQKAEYRPTPSYQASRDVSGPHSDGSSLSVNRPSHPFSEPARATTGGAISGTKKSEVGDYQHIDGVRRREHEELSTIPWHDDSKGPWKPTPGGPVPTIAEERERAKTQKTETPMKLHDLMKAQAAGKMQPLEKPPRSEAQRRAMGAAASGNSTLGIPKSVGKEFIDADKGGKLPEHKKAEETPGESHSSEETSSPEGSMEKAQCQCGKKDCKWCGSGVKKAEYNPDTRPSDSSEPSDIAPDSHDDFVGSECNSCKQNIKGRSWSRGYEDDPDEVLCDTCGRREAQKRRAPRVKKAEGGFQPTNRFSTTHPAGKLSPPKEQGEHGGSAQQSAAFNAPKRVGPGPAAPVVKTSIFKKAPEGLGKAETHAHANAKRNGGTIKLGKQEFYIDLANASDPKKRLKETNPVKESVVPGGKETGWQTDGTKPKVVERSASGGAISGNKPKAGPDQKNTAENSVVEGAASKSSGKNDLIEKAAGEYHKRMAKAAASMAAPKAPSAAGAGSPTLSAKPPAKPPAAAPGGTPMGGFGKAEFGIKQGAQQASFEAQHGQAVAPAAAPKAVPQPPSAYDPSLYQPTGPVHSGLELAGSPRSPVAPPGTGVTPRPAAPIKPRSPAMLKSIQGFSKSEMCKSCGKLHKAGQCV